ncbi:hypothetical protein EW638_04705 [Porphyromonas gingivalis]|nr:hypothetical protein EW638_04705 [Porphyromonas gingivalis]
MRSSCKQLRRGGIYNYFHSLLPPLSLAPFMRRTPLPSISLFSKGLKMVFSRPKRSVAWLLERSERLATGLSPVFFLPMAWLFSRLIRVKNVEVKEGGAGTWSAPPLRMCVFGSGLSSAVSY